MLTEKIVRIIGAPFGGGQTLDGVELAPEVMRKAGLREVCGDVGWKCEDIGDVVSESSAETSILEDLTSPESFQCMYEKSSSGEEEEHKVREDGNEYGETDIRNCKKIGDACHKIYKAVKKAAEEKRFALTIGGDHSIAAGSISGMLAVYPEIGIVWVDAHGDINIPETSPKGNYHGMVVAHLMGLFQKSAPGFSWMKKVPNLPFHRLAYIGLRDLDEEEKTIIKKNSIACFTMHEIDRYGIAHVIDKAIDHVTGGVERPLHLSFDIDACDPSITPGTGTKARGGLTYREAHYVCERIAETGRLVSADMVEISPLLDSPDQFFHGDQLSIHKNTTQTVRLGLELIASFLGKTSI